MEEIVMKKMVLSGIAAVAAIAFTGCSMCSDPIHGEITCIENSHFNEVLVRPNALALTKPNLAGSRELFRPVFKAGEKRITVVGEGLTRRIARNDAIAKFLETANCDYVVGVTTIVKAKTHPTWRFFSTTNYTVTLSGIPIHLEKLSCESLDAKKADEIAVVSTNDEEDGDKSDDKKSDEKKSTVETTTTVSVEKKCQTPPVLLSLSDIDVKISAKGSTDEKAGIIFPVKDAKTEKSVVSNSIVKSISILK